jgi:hypothetical protein
MDDIEYDIRFGKDPSRPISGNRSNRLYHKKCRTCLADENGIKLYENKIRKIVYNERVKHDEIILLKDDPDLYSLIKIIDGTSDINSALLYSKHDNLYIRHICKKVLGVKKA